MDAETKKEMAKLKREAGMYQRDSESMRRALDRAISQRNELLGHLLIIASLQHTKTVDSDGIPALIMDGDTKMRAEAERALEKHMPADSLRKLN